MSSVKCDHPNCRSSAATISASGNTSANWTILRRFFSPTQYTRYLSDADDDVFTDDWVVLTETTEIIRVISIRKATRHEQALFFEALQN